MKILFIAHWNEEKENNIGKKLQGQVNAFEELGHEVTSIQFFEGAVWAVRGLEKKRLFTVSDGGFAHLLAIPKAIHVLINSGQVYDVSYARRTFCTPWHLAMLRELKKNGVFTIEELSTYPYDEENKISYTKKSYQIAAQIEKVCRKFYHYWLDLFTTMSQDQKIFGVPAIHVENGIDLKKTSWAEHQYFPNGKIRLITISSMKVWHGYERLINGLAAYKEKSPDQARRFTIEMVGDGPERQKWEMLARTLKIEDQVNFHGNQTGASLDAIIDRCQIAVGSLGCYKASSGMQTVSTLKNREYLAHGIPFIYEMQDSLPIESSYSLQVEGNDTSVDFSAIKDFYDTLIQQKNISLHMRQFAEKNLSWKSQLKHVLDVVEKKGS